MFSRDQYLLFDDMVLESWCGASNYVSGHDSSLYSNLLLLLRDRMVGYLSSTGSVDITFTALLGNIDLPSSLLLFLLDLLLVAVEKPLAAFQYISDCRCL